MKTNQTMTSKLSFDDDECEFVSTTFTDVFTDEYTYSYESYNDYCNASESNKKNTTVMIYDNDFYTDDHVLKHDYSDKSHEHKLMTDCSNNTAFYIAHMILDRINMTSKGLTLCAIYNIYTQVGTINYVPVRVIDFLNPISKYHLLFREKFSQFLLDNVDKKFCLHITFYDNGSYIGIFTV